MSLLGFVVPFRAPFGKLVAALADAPPGAPAPKTPVGATKPELELENAVDDGNEDKLADGNDESRPELDDRLGSDCDRRDDLDDAPAAFKVALLPVMALIIAGTGPELDALLLTARLR